MKVSFYMNATTGGKHKAKLFTSKMMPKTVIIILKKTVQQFVHIVGSLIDQSGLGTMVSCWGCVQ